MRKPFLLFILTILPIVAMADAVEIDGIFFNLNGEEKVAEVTIKPSYYTGVVNIPQTVTYENVTYNVTSIGKQAFERCSSLTSVTIPNGVKSIGISAFFWSGLTSVTIPNSVTSIGGYAFAYCKSLSSVTIPNSVTSIEEATFADCSGLTSMTIPNSVKSIGWSAFNRCSGLTSVSIGSGVQNIGGSAFLSCSELRDIYCYAENVPLTESLALDDAVLEKCTLHVPAGSVNVYKASEPWSGFKSIVAISSAIVFADAKVKALCIANWDTDGDGELTVAEAAAVTDLGIVFNNNTTITSFDELRYFTGLQAVSQYAFTGCKNLVSITLPNSVTTIGMRAFWECSGLTSVTIPNSVTVVEAQAFGECTGLTSVHTTDIESWCKISFSYGAANPLAYAHHLYVNGSEITELVIPNSITSISDFAFYGCSDLKSVTIPTSMTNIGTAAFYDCNRLTTLNIPNSVTSIGQQAFERCTGLTSVTIPNSLTSIGDMLFRYCTGLTSVTIPNSVTSIGIWSFLGCSGLTSVSIGSGIQSIGSYAFGNCPKLTDVYCFAENVPETQSNAFGNSNIENATLHVPDASINAYKVADPWKNFKNMLGHKCATPTIKLIGGKLHFECETEGVEFHYEFTASESEKGTGNDIAITPTYAVTVYASKEGYTDSEEATINIDAAGIKGDVNQDGVVSITDIIHLLDIILQGEDFQ